MCAIVFVLLAKTGTLDTLLHMLRPSVFTAVKANNAAAANAKAEIAATESNIKEDRTDLDLLFGCLLDWGLPLSMPYYSETIDGCTVHTYDPDSGAYPNLIACFNENIPDTVIKEIARRKPVRAVFRDSSFATSPEKINVGEIFKLLAPDTRVKVI